RQPLPLVDAILDAELGRAASRRLEREVESAAAVAIGDLGERRRLEALAVAQVRVQVIVRMKDNAGDGARVAEVAAAAVVGILVGDVVIFGVVTDVAVANAERA